MPISFQIKRHCGQSRTGEQHTPEPEKIFNSNSYNSTTSSISNSHNSPTYYFLLFPNVDHEETERSIRPFWQVASRQLEAIQSHIKVPEAEAETEGSPSDIPPIFQAPPHQSRAARQGLRDNSQTPRSNSVGPEYISDKRKDKRGRTEDSLNPRREPDNDRPPTRVPLKKKPAMNPNQKERSQTAPLQSSISGFSFNNRGSGTMISKDVGNVYNTTICQDVVADRRDQFIYFLYFLAFCAFLIFLLLLSIIFIFLPCLNVLATRSH